MAWSKYSHTKCSQCKEIRMHKLNLIYIPPRWTKYTGRKHKTQIRRKEMEIYYQIPFVWEAPPCYQVCFLRTENSLSCQFKSIGAFVWNEREVDVESTELNSVENRLIENLWYFQQFCSQQQSQNGLITKVIFFATKATKSECSPWYDASFVRLLQLRASSVRLLQDYCGCVIPIHNCIHLSLARTAFPCIPYTCYLHPPYHRISLYYCLNFKCFSTIFCEKFNAQDFI